MMWPAPALNTCPCHTPHPRNPPTVSHTRGYRTSHCLGRPSTTCLSWPSMVPTGRRHPPQPMTPAAFSGRAIEITAMTWHPQRPRHRTPRVSGRGSVIPVGGRTGGWMVGDRCHGDGVWVGWVAHVGIPGYATCVRERERVCVCVKAAGSRIDDRQRARLLALLAVVVVRGTGGGWWVVGAGRGLGELLRGHGPGDSRMITSPSSSPPPLPRQCIARPCGPCRSSIIIVGGVNSAGFYRLELP